MELKEINEALAKLGDQVKEAGEKAIAEAAKGVAMGTSAKEKVDEMLVKQGELMGRLQGLEQRADAFKSGGGGAGPQSVGEEVVTSEQFKNYVAAGDFRKGVNIPVKAVVNMTTGANGTNNLIEPDKLPGIQQVPTRRLTVRDLLTPGRTNSNLIQYVRESGFQNMAATVAEGTLKPKSDVSFDMVATAVVKLATYVKASTEILQDAPMLQSYIDGRLRYMLAYVEESQLLNGSGVGNNLNGIYTQASVYANPLPSITSPTSIDLLRLAFLQSELAQFPATGVVLHPADWTRIELTKDTTGNYIFANPQSIAQPTLWGRPVVQTQAMPMDSFLAGAFRLGAQIFDRIGANISVATENEDDFIRNMVTILIEERLGLAVYRPQAFVKGDFGLVA